MKILIIILIALIGHLQYRLWFGDGSITEIRAYQQRLDDLSRSQALAWECLPSSSA